MQIISAITTCAKRQDYLQETLASLHDAGFDPTVVMDAENQGSWPNFRNALGVVQHRATSDSDAIVIFQDDIKVSRGLFAYLESFLWPAPIIETIGVVSLYTAAINARDETGWYEMSDLPHDNPFGALAYVMPAKLAFELRFGKYRNYSIETLTGTDTNMGNFCRQFGLSYWMHSPSFVKHIGIKSSVNDSYEVLEKTNPAFVALNRQCRDFVADAAQICAEDATTQSG